MADGSQQCIAAVCNGDSVRSHDGSINSVVKVNKRTARNEKMLKIKIAGILGDDFSFLKVTSGHKILTDRNGKIDFVQAGNLNKGDFLLTPCKYERADNFKISNDFAFLIGVYAAEGCGIPYEHENKQGIIEKYYKGVYFALSSDEYDTLAQEIKNKIKNVYGNISVTIRKDSSRTIISAYGQNIADDLNGACSGLSSYGTKRLSPWVMKCSNENLIHVMAGFFSGDGCYNVNNGFQGVGVSRKLADQMANICDIIGVEYSYGKNRAPGNRQVIYNVRISRRACKIFEKLSYKVKNNRNIDEEYAKNIPYFVKGKYIYRKIYSIEEYIYDGDLYDLSVEGPHSYVANRISVHNSAFPINGFENICKDRKVKRHFDKLVKKIKLLKWCKLISHEIHLLGDCFPFIEIKCDHCLGSGRLDGEVCEHEGGTVKRLVILNPDFVEVHTGSMNPDPLISLKPDEELVNMVQKKIPGFEKLAPDVRALIASGRPIRLDNKSVSHLKYGESGYATYGIGMVRRLFPILSYKTKLMVAQWIIAERLILPIKIVKVGSDERPAGPADIAAVQQQLAQTANDPNLTLVTHHAFELVFEGAAGKVLTLTNEFELINQEILDGLMLNSALLNGEGPSFCHSDDTRILTNNGLKYRQELDIEKDMIVTFNKNNGALEYQKATKKIEFNHDSINGDSKPLKHFVTKRIDILVTDNHRMLYAPRKLTTGPNGQKIDGQTEGFGEWSIVSASEVKKRGRFRACFDKWVGTTKEEDEYFGIKKEDFLQIVGWYISEGNRRKDNNRHGKIYGVAISQSPTANPDVYLKIKKVLSSNNICKIYPSSKSSFIISNTANKELVSYLVNNCGQLSNLKMVPVDIKNMSTDSLKILLTALVEGDGSERPATRKKETNKKYYVYTTVSTQLRDDVVEILFKLGFSPRFSTSRFDSNTLQTIYNVSWSDTENGKFPVLDSRKWNNGGKSQTKKQVIFDEDYIGKVWCVDVPNHFIVTERNGLFGIHGNSTAAVGIEAMIERLDSFRKELSEWIEEFIFKPEAIRQGFIDKDADSDEEEYLYPKLKWNPMHLRDLQQDKTFALQLYEKGILSAQTLLELFGYNPDLEIERKRYDAIQLMALGQGQGAGAGGAPGGMGGGFSGGGGTPGGMPPMPDMGGGAAGGAPGGEAGGLGGAPGAGGGAPISPAGGVGGAAPMSSALSSVTASVADPANYGGRVLTQKTRQRLDQEKNKIYKQTQTNDENEQLGPTYQVRDAKGRIIFTKPERELMAGLVEYSQNGLIKYPVTPQFEVKYGNMPYPLDFAIPHLKIGLEADGETFHSSPDQITKDKERDQKLAQMGWTILRFTEGEISDTLPKVLGSIVKTIMQKELLLKNQQKQIENK
jgi:intein/homing endonuclease